MSSGTYQPSLLLYCVSHYSPRTDRSSRTVTKPSFSHDSRSLSHSRGKLIKFVRSKTLGVMSQGSGESKLRWILPKRKFYIRNLRRSTSDVLLRASTEKQEWLLLRGLSLLSTRTTTTHFNFISIPWCTGRKSLPVRPYLSRIRFHTHKRMSPLVDTQHGKGIRR